MKRIEEDENDIEIPNEDDENVGDGIPKKKKRKKTREERIAERKIIFWTLVVIMVITLAFWLIPKIGKIFNGEPEIMENKSNSAAKTVQEKRESGKYMEISL